LQHDLDAPYEIQTIGTLALVDTGLSVDLSNTWRLIRIERGDAAVVEASSGKLRIVGPTANLNFDGATTLRSGDIPAIAIETRGSFVGDRIDFESLTVANDWARLFANGELLLSPEPSWRFDVELTDVEPAVADDRLSGKLAIIGKTSGRLADAKPLLDFDIRRISGDLNGYTVDGKGKLSYAKEQLTFDGAVVRVGNNRVDFDGSYGKRLQINARARFSDLSQFGLGVAGRIDGDIRLASDLKTFQATGDVSAAGLAWGDYVVDALEAEFDLPAASKGTLRLQVSSAEQGTVSTEIDGQFENRQWNGSVRKLALLREPVGEWALREPADISLSQSHLKLAKLCLANPSIDGLVCSAIDYDFSGPLQFESSVDALPLAALPRNLPEGASILGVINAAASGTFANRRLDAIASLRIDGLGLVASFEGDEVSARFEKASASATIVDNKLIGEFEFRLDNGVDHAAGSVEIADLSDPASALLGEGNLEFNDLALASFFVPDIANPIGRIFGHLDAAGSLIAPEIAGEVGLDNGSVDIRRAGISVTEIELLLRQSKAGEVALKGRAKSGDGYLGISGKTQIGVDTGIRSEIRLDGEDFELIRLPDWRITTSPAIAVVFDERATRISGELSIPEASITIKSIPETTEKPS
ncbi:MAG: translocation/assembly module TamB domain-containing protein, partial [Woeseiaceae bacterium]